MNLQVIRTLRITTSHKQSRARLQAPLHRLPASLSHGDTLLHARVQTATVGQAGQSVVVGDMTKGSEPVTICELDNEHGMAILRADDSSAAISGIFQATAN